MDGIPDLSKGNHAVLRATKVRVKSESLSRTSQHDRFDDTPHAQDVKSASEQPSSRVLPMTACVGRVICSARSGCTTQKLLMG